MAKDGLDLVAEELDKAVRARGLATQYDDGGSIGRRYARMDEIGTPYCITVDHQALEDGTVTIRDRDSTKQKRICIDDAAQILADLLVGNVGFENLEAK